MPMTLEGFRKLALGMPEADENAHMGHPDFRVRGRIFATLCAPSEEWGMVKLTPEQQAALVEAEPTVFVPVKEGWGREQQGSPTARVVFLALGVAYFGGGLASWLLRPTRPRIVPCFARELEPYGGTSSAAFSRGRATMERRQGRFW
jgi:hypothetical protein